MNDERWFHRDENGKGIEVCLGACGKERTRKKPNTEDTGGTEFAEKRKQSDVEIEEEEKQAKDDEEGGAVDAAAREAAEGADKGSRNGSETGFIAENVERADRSVAGKGAAKNGDFIMNPNGEIVAVAPHPSGAQS
jgi:hypothetical protein